MIRKDVSSTRRHASLLCALVSLSLMACGPAAPEVDGGQGGGSAGGTGGGAVGGGAGGSGGGDAGGAGGGAAGGGAAGGGAGGGAAGGGAGGGAAGGGAGGGAAGGGAGGGAAGGAGGGAAGGTGGGAAGGAGGGAAGGAGGGAAGGAGGGAAGGAGGGAGPCTNGTVICDNSGNISTCVANQYQTTTSCPFGCAGGQTPACLSQVTCAPGTHRCRDLTTIEYCNAAGTAWLTGATCAGQCTNGACTGACTPNEMRCTGNTVETCNTGGTAWTVTDTCTSSETCDLPTATCAPQSLTIDIGQTVNFDGVLVVDGPLVVKTSATLSSPAGNLTIRARSITVEAGGSISVAATGTTAAGRAYPNVWYNVGGHGAGYGAAGSANTYSTGTASDYGYPGPAFGVVADADVSPGSQGAQGGLNYNNPGGRGGGVLRLIADTITIDGTVSAIGAPGTPGSSGATYGGGGGSGGGILLAANALTLGAQATISTAGGAAGTPYTSCSNQCAGAGGRGRVKLLYGATFSNNATIIGTLTTGLLPPLVMTSPTHPDSSYVYNDAFASFGVSWERPFPLREGYWHTVNTLAPGNAPAPAQGVNFANLTEFASYDRSKFGTISATTTATQFYFRLVTATSSNIGTIENRFPILLTAAVPGITTPTHPNTDLYYDGASVSTQWSFPSLTQNTKGDANWVGTYYLLDQYGDTIPGPSVAGSSFAPNTKKQQPFVNLADGAYMFHVITVDQRNVRTAAAAHRMIRVKAGASAYSLTAAEMGSVSGIVTVGGSPVQNVRVSVNRGLFPTTTNRYVATSSSGAYSITSVPVGTYKVRAQQVDTGGNVTATLEQDITVTGATVTTANLAF